jgi:predicted nucleic acid-binding protein
LGDVVDGATCDRSGRCATLAEMSARFPSLAEAQDFADALELVHAVIPKVALFAAGKAFRAYRDAGGSRENVLLDFFIGAHALILGMPLLTRDPKPFRAYFPTLELITP